MREQLTPSKLWKRMSLEQRMRAARAFWGDDEAAADHAQAAMYIAQEKKFRPKTVALLDLERKARHLGSLKVLPDSLASHALVAYHLSERRPMMSAFLDALGIEHDDGLIKDDRVIPEQARLAPAVTAIAEQFSPEDVSLYLNTLLCQDPETWGALGGLPQLAALEA